MDSENKVMGESYMIREKVINNSCFFSRTWPSWIVKLRSKSIFKLNLDKTAERQNHSFYFNGRAWHLSEDELVETVKLSNWIWSRSPPLSKHILDNFHRWLCSWQKAQRIGYGGLWRSMGVDQVKRNLYVHRYLNRMWRRFQSGAKHLSPIMA